MERNQLIDALRRMQVETGSLVCLGCGQEHNCGVHGCAIIREDVLDQGARLEKTMNAAQRERMRLWGLANKCMDRVLGAMEE